MLRIASYRIHQSLVTKPLAIEKYWPLSFDKKVTTTFEPISRELLAQIKKAHKLI